MTDTPKTWSGASSLYFLHCNELHESHTWDHPSCANVQTKNVSCMAPALRAHTVHLHTCSSKKCISAASTASASPTCAPAARPDGPAHQRATLVGCLDGLTGLQWRSRDPTPKYRCQGAPAWEGSAARLPRWVGRGSSTSSDTATGRAGGRLPRPRAGPAQDMARNPRTGPSRQPAERPRPGAGRPASHGRAPGQEVRDARRAGEGRCPDPPAMRRG